MQALEKWSPLKGINGGRVFVRLDDIILVEEIDVKGEACCLLINRYGVRTTVEHDAEEMMGMIENYNKELIEKNLDHWKKRAEFRAERKAKIDTTGDKLLNPKSPDDTSGK